MPSPTEWPDQGEMILHMPFLEHLASQARIVIELGCGHGNGSTRAFARGIERSPQSNKLFVSIDSNPDKPDCKPALSYWYKVNGDTRDPATISSTPCRGFANVIYIDTDHVYEQMRQELAVWRVYAGPNTVWAFHDTWMFGSYNPMTDAIKEFAAARSSEWEFADLTQESHGLGVMAHPDTVSKKLAEWRRFYV